MAKKNISHIIFAEFDIKDGSSTRFQHPSAVPGIQSDAIANFMLPEGGERFGVLQTYFTLNRRPIKDQIYDQQQKLQNFQLMQQKLLPPETVTKIQQLIKDRKYRCRLLEVNQEQHHGLP